MPIWLLLLILFLTFISFAIIHSFAKRKHPLKSSFLSMLTGVVTLTAVNLSSAFTGVYLPISLLSIIVSLVGGVPGVTLLLTLNLFF